MVTTPIEDSMSLTENINNLLNRMSTLKIDFLSPNLYLEQYEEYFEMLDEGIETLFLIKGMSKYFEERIISYPVLVLMDLTTQELLMSGTITRSVIYINIDTNFLYKFDNNSTLPGTHYFVNYFNSLSYINKFEMLIKSLQIIQEKIANVITMYKDNSDD